MSRFTRWRERQRAKEFLNSMSVLGEVKTIVFEHVDFSENKPKSNASVIKKNGVMNCSRMTLSVAPCTNQRIIKRALGGLVKPKSNYMKKYIGTKQVQAEPMTYGEAYKNGIIPESAHVSEYDENPGYLIQYADGYKSWSPAKVFEDSYKVAESVLDRVNIECSEIIERTNKLGVFIHNQNDGKDFQALPLGTRAMLIAQLHAMSAYSQLLNFRRSCMERGEECNPWELSFEQILPLIREGYAVRRNAWGEDGRMVFKQVPSHITSDIIPKMQSLPDEAKRQVLKAGDHIDYVAQCLIFYPQYGVANSWTPSIEDVFANDWELVL